MGTPGDIASGRPKIFGVTVMAFSTIGTSRRELAD
jgi:hypothetical protein